MKIKIKIEYLVIAAVLILATGTWILSRSVKVATKLPCDKDYKWVNPNLKCHDPVISKVGYATFKNKLMTEIETMKKKGDIDGVAVFFRDLESGPFFGIDEDENFIGASLFKTPVMMTYFKIAEDNPGLLSTELIYGDQAKDLFAQDFNPEESVEPGKPYTIDELIFRMIVYSDNRAYFMLIDYLNKISPDVSLVLKTYKELGMVAENDDVEAADLSVRTYSSIFRILYNMSYLSDELSEKALNYLGHSRFKDGLRRSSPENVPIAHKFGERELNNGTKQLHDCGIVYYPGNPYLLCIMTRGRNMGYLEDAIGTISRMVYQEVDSRRQ